MDTSKPFIGYKSAGRRPERDNDREGAKNAPLAAIRGWVAGTAGLPGDLTQLARMIPGADRVVPDLPTSDFYKEWLPLRGESATERAFTEAGSLFGGAGATNVARAARTGLSAGSRGALNAIEVAARNAAVPRTLSPQAGVIKMKGGNWVDDTIDEVLTPLRFAQVRGGRAPEVMLADMRAKFPSEALERLSPTTRSHTDRAFAELEHKVANNDWVTKKLGKYIRNEMGTPEDPIRALAERGVLHVQPEQLNFRPEMHGKYMVEGQTAVAESLPAKTWEGAADTSIGTVPSTLRKIIAGSNPWMDKLPEDAKIYMANHTGHPREFANDLGFDHLVDELRNATNPRSDLPAQLLWKYSDLNKVTVPQAVERVSRINAWRAAQKAEADMVKANNAATVLHKEYPEGYRWVELKTPDNIEVPEFVRADQSYTQRGLRIGDQYYSVPYGDPGVTHESVAKAVAQRKALEDALKYEGDTMGHCVGGYCDDVASGKSRIYSLRDKKGQPHTTIEIAPSRKLTENDLPDDVRDMLADTYGDASREEFEAAVARAVQERQTGDRIVQIKGKQNKAPNPEYLPYVQDFVRSGKWSDVGDLQNTGLYKHPGSGELIDKVEYDDLMSGRKGFARGGAVNTHDYDPNRVDALVQALEAGFGQ